VDSQESRERPATATIGARTRLVRRSRPKAADAPDFSATPTAAPIQPLAAANWLTGTQLLVYSEESYAETKAEWSVRECSPPRTVGRHNPAQNGPPKSRSLRYSQQNEGASGIARTSCEGVGSANGGQLGVCRSRVFEALTAAKLSADASGVIGLTGPESPTCLDQSDVVTPVLRASCLASLYASTLRESPKRRAASACVPPDAASILSISRSSISSRNAGS
jgi:hypothetical protein